jgi:gas vesicle structural protein
MPSAMTRAPRPSSLADVLDLILDKGLVIDAYVRVSLVGIEILTIDARIVIASVDTYLHFAEAVNRLDLGATETQGIPELLGTSNGSGEDTGNGSQRSASRPQNQNQSSGSRSSSSRGAQAPPARALGRGGRSGDGDEDESGSRRGALVGRIAARGRYED